MELFASPKTSFAKELGLWRLNQLITARVDSFVRESTDAKNILRASTTVA